MTDRHTDAGDFIICPMLRYSNGTDNNSHPIPDQFPYSVSVYSHSNPIPVSSSNSLFFPIFTNVPLSLLQLAHIAYFYAAVKSQNTVKPNPLCRLPVTSATSRDVPFSPDSITPTSPKLPWAGSFGEVGVMEFGLKGTSQLVSDVTGSQHGGLGFTVFWLFTAALYSHFRTCSPFWP